MAIFLIPRQIVSMKKTLIEKYCFIFANIYQNINAILRSFLQLPAKYFQLPVILIGQIETLIRRIRHRRPGTGGSTMLGFRVVSWCILSIL